MHVLHSFSVCPEYCYGGEAKVHYTSNSEARAARDNLAADLRINGKPINCSTYIKPHGFMSSCFVYTIESFSNLPGNPLLD
jgi:hypothetical protein